MAFSPDGQMLATGSKDGLAALGASHAPRTVTFRASAFSCAGASQMIAASASRTHNSRGCWKAPQVT